MRTHGVGVRIEDHSEESTGAGVGLTTSAVPYVVGFETPVIVCPEDVNKEPVRLRWVAPASSSVAGSSSSSSSSSTGSSRERSVYCDFSWTGSEVDSSSLSESESPVWRGRERFC